MQQSNSNSKNTAIVAALVFISAVLYYLVRSVPTAGDGSIFAPLVIGSAAIILGISSGDKKLGTIAAGFELALVLLIGIVKTDIVTAIVSTLMVAAIGLFIGKGISNGKPFKDYMLHAIATTVVLSIFSIAYHMMLDGIYLSVDNAVDYYIAPMREALSIYSEQLGPDYEYALGQVESMIRWLAIGTFCSNIIVEVFLAYVLAGAINAKTAVTNHKFFAALIGFRISRFGCIIFILCFAIDILTGEGHMNLFGSTMNSILKYPMALCGISGLYGLLTAYKAKPTTKHIVVVILSVLALIPYSSIATGLAFMGVIDCFFALAESGDDSDKTNRR